MDEYKTFRYYIDTAMTGKQPMMVRLGSVTSANLLRKCDAKVSSTVLKTKGCRDTAEFNSIRKAGEQKQQPKPVLSAGTHGQHKKMCLNHRYH